jgi:hypothetical protein
MSVGTVGQVVAVVLAMLKVGLGLTVTVVLKILALLHPFAATVKLYVTVIGDVVPFVRLSLMIAPGI